MQGFNCACVCSTGGTTRPYDSLFTSAMSPAIVMLHSKLCRMSVSYCLPDLYEELASTKVQVSSVSFLVFACPL